MEKVGYIRVSTKGQNEARQVKEFEKLGIKEKNIYLDKESGGSFERTGYLYLKKRLRKGDIKILPSIAKILSYIAQILILAGIGEYFIVLCLRPTLKSI